MVDKIHYYHLKKYEERAERIIESRRKLLEEINSDENLNASEKDYYKVLLNFCLTEKVGGRKRSSRKSRSTQRRKSPLKKKKRVYRKRT